LKSLERHNCDPFLYYVCTVYILIISHVLTQIFNLSIAKSDFHSPFKLAKVIPIHKRGLKADHSNYRPISILPMISLININYWSNMYSNSRLYQRQSGLREHHSCQTTLIKINDWLTAIERNMASGSLFLDLSKAFDLVNLKLLIDKLQLYNIDTHWFSSCLQTRFQQTIFVCAMSDTKAVISDVPQGSVLGLIPFLIYIYK